MRAAWNVFCLFAVILVAALGVAHLLVPDIVPIAFAEEPQPTWAVMTAFLLRTIEMIAAAVAIISLALFLALFAGAHLRHELRRWSRSASSRKASQAD